MLTASCYHQGTFDQDVFEKLLSEWIAACDHPFQEVERPEFQRVLQYVRGCIPLEFPSADTVKRRIIDLSNTNIEETKVMIQVSASDDRRVLSGTQN